MGVCLNFNVRYFEKCQAGGLAAERKSGSGPLEWVRIMSGWLYFFKHTRLGFVLISASLSELAAEVAGEDVEFLAVFGDGAAGEFDALEGELFDEVLVAPGV